VRRVVLAVLAGLVALGVIGGGIWWFGRPEPVSGAKPAGAPAVGSCWTVDAAASREAHPWPGRPVDCAQPHTVEIFLLGQVNADLIRQARDGEGDDAKLAAKVPRPRPPGWAATRRSPAT
jgi:hypothetical protein